MMVRWAKYSLLCTLLGGLTTILIAWTIAATAEFTEIADPHARAIVPVNYTMYSVRRGESAAPSTLGLEQRYRGKLSESITDESIRDAHAFFGSLPVSDDNASPDQRFFSHRQFRSRAATREVLDRFDFDAHMSWEFFSTKPAMLAPPNTVAMFKQCFPSPAWPAQFGTEVVIKDEYGWPFAALSGSLTITTSDWKGPHVTTAQWAIPLDWRSATASPLIFAASASPHDAARMLPMRPLLGLLADTAVFGGVWGVILYVPGLVRRSVRRRQGLCTKCAYDLRATPAGHVCPECGKARWC